MRRVLFQGKPYILTHDEGGAIADEEDFQTGRASYAHLFPDGRILRHGTQIGTKTDLTFLEECAIGPVDLPTGLRNLLRHLSWRINGSE